MAHMLVPGQNCFLPEGHFEIKVIAGAPADFSVFRLYADARILKDGDFIFYGQPVADDLSIELVQEKDSAIFRIAPERLRCEKISFCASSDFPAIAGLKSLALKIRQNGTTFAICNVDVKEREEAALIIGEMYRRDAAWKFRFVCQGFSGGLKILAEHFGVEILEKETAPQTPPRPQPPAKAVNLDKIVLTKAEPKVDLGKHDLHGGIYKVNLNWHQKEPNRASGTLARLFNRHKGIDLDLGAYVRLKNGKQTIVQALGNRFGNLNQFPYVKLLGDDRTGEMATGEWIYINGDKIDDIAEIIIFTFIYSGVPNWSSTDGIARLEIPGQPEIETMLAGYDNTMTMCAIARIENAGSNLRVERLDRYFTGHVQMDHAFNWGFRWTAGKK